MLATDNCAMEADQARAGQQKDGETHKALKITDKGGEIDANLLSMKSNHLSDAKHLGFIISSQRFRENTDTQHDLFA